MEPLNRGHNWVPAGSSEVELCTALYMWLRQQALFSLENNPIHIQSVLFNREVPRIIRTYTCTVGHGVLCLLIRYHSRHVLAWTLPDSPSRVAYARLVFQVDN